MKPTVELDKKLEEQTRQVLEKTTQLKKQDKKLEEQTQQLLEKQQEIEKLKKQLEQLKEIK